MEGLTGPIVKLTLYIKEGRGFGFLQNPILIVARLCSNTLQTNIYPPVAEPQFHEELLWEVDKQTLRRLRTGKVPVKVECFTLSKQNQRSKVGTVLLDLRSAHIVAKGRSAHGAPDSWHKMQCGSGRCPEMLLCLRVEDMKNESQACGDIVSVKSPRESICTTGSTSPDRSTQSDTQIQVGPVMMATDIFELTVRVVSSENLSAFKTWSDVNFTCHMFGAESQSSSFNRQAIGECVVSIRSSLQFLRQYLENNPLLWVRLLLGSEEIGATQINIASIVPTVSLAEFLERYANSDRSVETEKRCVIERKQVSQSDLLLNVLVRLKHCQLKTKALTTLAEQPRVSCIEAAGDQGTNSPTSEYHVRPQTSDSPTRFAADNEQLKSAVSEHNQKPTAKNTVTKDFWQLPTETPASNDETYQLNVYENRPSLIPSAGVRDPSDAVSSASDSRLLNLCPAAPALIASEPALGPREFRSFSLHVELQSVLLHAAACGQRLRFALRHPQARAINEWLGEVEVPPPGAISALTDVACRLRFVSTANEIGRLLLAYPPKVNVQCFNAGCWGALASAALDTSRLLAERRRVLFPAPLIDAQGCEVGVLYVALDLRDDGARRERDNRVGPAVLDERIAHEAVEELEEWKERQQEHFKAQLSAKEAEHLEQLTADFQRRCADSERQLELRLKQTSELADRLERETEACAVRDIAQVRAQANLELRAEQLEQRFKAQMEMLRDASARMEDDLLHKAKLTENKCVELRAVNARLEKENAALRATLEERDKELFNTHLTQDQTAAILQDMRALEEKLDAAGRSKAYFKEQWRAVAQELHKLKTEHHTQMQMQIRDSRQSIQALGFQRLLNKEAEELDTDQKLLQQLKSELSKDFSEDDDARPLNSHPTKSASNLTEAPSTQRGHQEMLRSLIDERDLLLRTGRFNVNDHAIDRINQQIRSQTNLL